MSFYLKIVLNGSGISTLMLNMCKLEAVQLVSPKCCVALKEEVVLHKKTVK